MSKWFLLLLLPILALTACEKEELTVAETDATELDATVDTRALSTLTNDMLIRVNALRTAGCQCGTTYMPPVPALTANEKLQNAAIRHANDMYTKKFFSHTGSDGSNVATRTTQAGYKWRAVGENIAFGYTSLDAVMNGWKNSVGHCKNMMSPNFTQFGAARTGNYWVQVLAKPF